MPAMSFKEITIRILCHFSSVQPFAFLTMPAMTLFEITCFWCMFWRDSDELHPFSKESPWWSKQRHAPIWAMPNCLKQSSGPSRSPLFSKTNIVAATSEFLLSVMLQENPVAWKCSTWQVFSAPQLVFEPSASHLQICAKLTHSSTNASNYHCSKHSTTLHFLNTVQLYILFWFNFSHCNFALFWWWGPTDRQTDRQTDDPVNDPNNSGKKAVTLALFLLTLSTQGG